MMESTKRTSSMIVPEVLTKDNYGAWKIFMESYLLGKGLWDTVEGSDCKPEPTNPEFKAWRMRNGEALHVILISCGEEMFSLIGETDSAKDAWDCLASMFQKRIISDAIGTDSSDGEEEMAAADSTAAGHLQAVYRAAYSSDWETTKSLLEKYPDSITAILSTTVGTVLHAAVKTGNVHFVNQLLKIMTPDAIETVIKSFSITPLYMAAGCGFTEIVEALVGKDRNSLEIPGNRDYFPVLVACANSHKDTTRYLYGVTRKEALIEGNGTQGATLVNMAIDGEMYDIAIDLLRDYPQLSITIDFLERTTIRWLSWMPNAFASGGHHNIWQHWIYSIPGIKRIHKKKKNHVDALKVLKIVCSQLSSLDEPRLQALGVHDSLFSAVEFGIVEIVSEIAKINPDFLSTELNGENVFSNAILFRQEKVFNFLYGNKELLDLLLYGEDNEGNNLLHYAGMLSPPSQQGKMAGAALQMQRELQWFQEVEEIIPLEFQDRRNKEGLKPGELFTKQHAELVEKGEKWMKDTANSCMIVATLITTVTFAAAFTVPGGNDSELGFPIFLSRKLFLPFMISDALSLFSSSTSVLMFVSIYTSRYAEKDFLNSLPNRLIIGLSTLFFSILTMMVAFCATMFLTLGQHSKWAAILVTFLSAVPVILFIRLQFPLFLDMILATYGPGLFLRKGKKHLHMLYCSVV